MGIKTVSSREFNQNVSGVKKASSKGPVFITHRGEAAHVLLTIEEYRKLSRHSKETKEPNILDLLSMPEGDDIEFDPEPLPGSSYRPANLSD